MPAYICVIRALLAWCKGPRRLINFTVEELPLKQLDERSFKDPVCGMEVSRITAAEEYVYQGKTYYFCARTCLATFTAEPGKYIRHHRQHGIKPN